VLIPLIKGQEEMLTLDRASRARKAFLWTLLAVWAVLAMHTAPRQTFAQDADKSAEKATEKAADAAPTEKAPVKESESVFLWVIKVSGFIGLFILCLSIYFVATISRLFIEMRPVVAMPPEIIARCEALLEQRDFKSIFGVVKDDNSFFSTALSTGIAELPNGLAEAREAMEKIGESVTAEMEKKISMLAVLGTLGPMIGLLGTLKGMITAFSIIARSGQGIDPGQVANAISEALVLTFEGVILSVPAIYFYALFRNRVSTISVTTMVRADQFLRHFAHAARSKAPAGGAAKPAPAAAAAPRA
jgi:biopolymer transport protein ExbB